MEYDETQELPDDLRVWPNLWYLVNGEPEHPPCLLFAEEWKRRTGKRITYCDVYKRGLVDWHKTYED